MKITKRQLRRIIKEEVARINEQGSRFSQLEKIENEIPNAVVIDFGIDAESSAVRATDFNYGTVQKIQDWLEGNGFSVAFVDEDNHGIASVIAGPNVWGME
jgi:hypothetical protein